ncbi:MAG: glycosyltransferase family 1 protein [Candidatus Aegiribacteria sp.]
MNVIRAAFDLSPVPHAVGGVSRYLTRLAAAMRVRAPDFDVELVLVDVPAAHPGVPGPPLECLETPAPLYMKIPLVRRIPIRRGWERSSRPRRLARLTGCPAIYHHSGVQPFHPPGSLSVVTVYDLSALEHSEWHTEATVSFAEREAAMIRGGAFAAAISRWTASRMVRTLGVPEERVYVAGGAAGDEFAPGPPSTKVMQEYGLSPGDYFLHVGNFVPRKNIPLLIEAYAASRRRGVDIPLVMVGEGGWGNVRMRDVPGLRVLRGVPDRRMPDLYRGARALLCPSRYEGLGLPVLEAFACNTPVVSSSSTALPETVGEGGVLLSPDRPEQWVEEMTALSDPSRADVLRRMSESVERVRWSDVAAGLLEFYRRIAGE